MRAASDQAKIECVNLQLCAGLEAGIEGATHAVGQRQIEKLRGRRCEEEEADDYAEEEEESGGTAACLNNLTMETAGTGEEVA